MNPMRSIDLAVDSVVQQQQQIVPSETEQRSVRTLVQLLREIVPLLENVKISIHESSAKIPKATQQLDKVTEATENATVEILNVVETITENIDRSEKMLADVQKDKEHLVQELEHIQKKIGGDYTASLSIDCTDIGQKVNNVLNLLQKTKEDSMNITMALQVQDITSQQLAGVAHIIDSVEQQLVHVLERFENGDTAREPLVTEPAKAFDIDAQFTKSPIRQNVADEIVNQWLSQK